MSYLNETNPEVFFVLPRPGGIANIELPEVPEVPMGPRGSKGTLKSNKSVRSSKSRSRSFIDSKFFSSTPGVISREHRIKHALTTVPWILFDDHEEEDGESTAPAPNPLQDTIDMLAIAITTIMLLAAGHKEISQDHLRWTLSYLECVRDEYGNNPPNIKGIMNHIKMIDGTLESFNDSFDMTQPEKEDQGAKAAVPAQPADPEAGAEPAEAEAEPAEAEPAEG